MYDLKAFRQRVQELCRHSSPYDGRRATQRDLAEAIGLHPTELSKRLNGAKDARLSDRDVRAIVLTFAEWGAISTQAEALDLLNLVGTASFTPAEWQSPPLDLLEPPATQNQTPQPVAAHRPGGRNSNLPTFPTSFIGRKREMAEVEQLLTQTRLLTIAGAGGCGKTRLAVEVAQQLVGRFPTGVWMVELGSLTDAQLVPQALASILGVREGASGTLLKLLLDAIGEKERLLVMDNCEHLVQPVADLTHQLLAHCPNLHILTTSREPLRTDGEVVWRLPSLSLPDPAIRPNLRSLAQYEAIRLFIERARAASPDVTLSQSNAEAVYEICVKLDGIPLAIELASVMVRSMSFEQINHYLSDRFSLLIAGSRTALPRQQTLRALIDWSYDLLTASEQRLFARLSVFAGGFDLEAARAVCADQHINASAVLIGLSQLVDKSLVVKENYDDSVRYRMLETIREYAAVKLRESAEQAQLRQRHALYYMTFAEQAEPQVRGAQQLVWLARLEREHDNLRAALGWGVEADVTAAALLGGALWKFWEIHGHFSEGRRWLAQVLDRADELSPAAQAKALNGAGMLAWNQSDHSTALAYLEQSLKLYRELDDKSMIARLLSSIAIVIEDGGDYTTPRTLLEESLAIYRSLNDGPGTALVLNNLGNLLVYLGSYDEAQVVLDETLALFRQLGEARGIAIVLHNMAIILTARGELARARALRTESLDIFRQLGDERNTAYVLDSLAELARQEGDYDEAQQMLEESLSVLRKLGDEWATAILLNNLGKLAINQGKFEQAYYYYRDGITLQHKIGNKKGISESLEGFASLAVNDGDMDRAAHLLGMSEALREATGTPLPPAELAIFEQNLAAVRAALGDDDLGIALAAGRAMSPDQTVAYALSGNRSL